MTAGYELRLHERWWFDRISELPCVVCIRLKFKRPKKREEFHHILDDDGRRISHLAVIPLCRKHHRTRLGVHRGYPQSLGISEVMLLADTIDLVTRGECPRSRALPQVIE